ncbi:MAG: hypothetical protein IOC90_09990 [Methylocystis sp.]|nr:hypothetical protein [Methylocystis sp.]MCA3584109.1 hypothetical protein [Methylocystis sp.]MCA3588348.1 hypothetical protein [Methylocystis sp.]MCA3591229.1 hypothetical protein [Methylocystis sp.]
MALNDNPKNAAVRKTRDLVKVEGDAQVERSARMLDPYLTTDLRFVGALRDNLMGHYESHAPARQRKMKEADRENLRAILTTILANLALAIAEGVDPPTIGVSLKAAKRKLTRYDRGGFTGLPRVLDFVGSAGGLLSLERSSRKGTASAITASPDFKLHLARLKFRPDHFAVVEGRETIWLSRLTRDYISGTESREMIDYRDTDETKRFRSEMTRINEALRKADIELASSDGPTVITSLRFLHRSFNLPPDAPEGTERFDLGGRLFGGWWMNLPKERRHLIRLAGEPVADLDFASMFVRLAFLEVGQTPPDGDLYAHIPGLREARWREGAKKVILAMLFRTTPLTRLPKDAKGLLPPRMSGDQARTAILMAFPALEPIFETGAGFRLMFLESQILIAALLDLADQKVPALPMHDGLMVPISKANVTARAMRDAAEKIVGFRLPITVKASYA